MTYKLDNNTETKDGYIFIETSYENVTNDLDENVENIYIVHLKIY